MVGILALWLPILAAAILVFFASSVLHMVLTHHRNDRGQVPQEDRVMAELRSVGLQPGDYAIPYAASSEALQDEEFRARAAAGPVAFLTVLPPGDPFNMKAQLTQWFLYAVVVGVFTAYVTGQTQPAGAPYLQVFQISGATAFMGYSLAGAQRSIWWGQPWSTTLKNTFDGLVYALLTAGAFGWLWPGG